MSTKPCLRFLSSRHPVRRLVVVLTVLVVLCGLAARGQVIKGNDWIVCFNLPSQSPRSNQAGEFAIRDTLIEQVNRLRRGHTGELATYTLSGDSATAGGAGPILAAVSNALTRGASMHFVADSTIDRVAQFGKGLSLNRLSRRRDNPMTLSVAPSSVLMHHKLGIFDFGGNEKWSFSASWNFTGGASINQWNIGVVLRNQALHAAYTAEMAEFRAKRFGKDKKRRHDGTTFRLQDSWGDCWVRFSPYHGSSRGTKDAETDIRLLIDSAEQEIFFALNRFNRTPIRNALVAAANRGVKVSGVISESDRAGSSPFAVSGPTYDYLADPANYRRGNKVELLQARRRAAGTELDSGLRDLVHCKYMIIDPNGRRPVVIHGSANWTAAGLSSADGNDESILFLRHADIARAFHTHFVRMTGASAAPASAVRMAQATQATRVEQQVIQLRQTMAVYSTKTPGKMVRLLRAGTPVKVMGEGTVPGMVTIRFNPYPGTIYEAQCRRSDLHLAN